MRPATPSLSVRIVEGQYEDNMQTFLAPVAFPMEDMTNYANGDIDADDYITLHNEDDLKAWCESAFYEWSIYNMTVPLRSIVAFDPGTHE